MKTLGLIGGVTWHSTKSYYEIINQLVGERLGNNHSAKLLLYSIDFAEFKKIQEENNWKQAEEMLCDIAMRLEKAGAEGLVICSNTPHMVADGIQKAIAIPLIHIAEVTAKEIKKQQLKKVGLLGTIFTMENNFFKDCLAKEGIETLVPEKTDRELIHASIINELTNGILLDETKNYYLTIMNKLLQDGAEAIIFGCTEISMLIHPYESPINIFDTTAIHANAAVDFTLTNHS